MTRASVIIPFYNAGDYLFDSIISVLNQSFKDFKLYLIDDGSTDRGQQIAEIFALNYHNVKYFRQENQGVSSARNRGLEFAIAEGSEFTFFLDADDKYKPDHIANCIDILEKYPESVFVSGITRFFEGQDELAPMYNQPLYKFTREVNTLADNTDALYVRHIAQGGWRTAVLENYRFNEKLRYPEDIDFICRILSKNKFVFSRNIEYLVRYAENSSVDLGTEKLQWYSRAWEVFRPLFAEILKERGVVPLFIQQTVIEDLVSLFAGKITDEIASQIDYEKLDEAIRFIIKHTDDSVLGCPYFNHWHKMYFLMLKYGESNLTRWAPIPTFIMNETGATDEGQRFGYLGGDPLVMHIINEKRGVLKIRVSMRCLTYKHFELDVRADFKTLVKEVPPPFERDKVYFCGKEIFPRKYYEITINLKKPLKRSDNGLIRFYLTTDYGVSVSVEYDALPHSGLGFNMPFTLGDEFIIKRTRYDNILSAAPITEKELLETCTDIEPYSGIGKPQKQSVKEFEVLKKSILGNFRTFSNRRIWLFMDRGYDIGNNAEALFRHCALKDDGIQKYYIIPDESFVERFAGLPYMILGSLEYKLLCCFAEKFISPYLFGGGLTFKFGVEKENKEDKEVWENICNFKKLARAFFRGDIIHVQHGVIMQDISYYLNKFDEDTRILLNVSQKEYNYIKNELPYAINPDILRLTGLPRNDYLEHTKNNPNSKKIILFAPSWDMKFDREGIYAPGYKYSAHYKYLSSVLNSQALLDMLEQKGYTLYFKPHHRVLPQLGDFTIDPRVRVINDEIDRYELYAMTDLMISDYSGIAFDFAYLKKPVVYAHFTPAKFDEVYFSYSRDGFGEICPDMEVLTKTVTDCIDKGCKMSEKYIERVDSFFSIQDGNNCERIYQELLKLPDTRKDVFR